MVPPVQDSLGHVVSFTLPFLGRKSTLQYYASQPYMRPLSISQTGHTKPLIVFLARLVRLSRIHVTLFTGLSILEEVRKQVDRQFLPDEKETLKQLIRYYDIS